MRSAHLYMLTQLQSTILVDSGIENIQHNTWHQDNIWPTIYLHFVNIFSKLFFQPRNQCFLWLSWLSCPSSISILGKKTSINKNNNELANNFHTFQKFVEKQANKFLHWHSQHNFGSEMLQLHHQNKRNLQYTGYYYYSTPIGLQGIMIHTYTTSAIMLWLSTNCWNSIPDNLIDAFSFKCCLP